jgi:hypothetical protein
MNILPVFRLFECKGVGLQGNLTEFVVVKRSGQFYVKSGGLGKSKRIHFVIIDPNSIML